MMLSSPEVSKLDSSSFEVQNILYLLISHFFSPLYLSNKVLIKRSIVFLILYSDVKSHIVHHKTSSCNFFHLCYCTVSVDATYFLFWIVMIKNKIIWLTFLLQSFSRKIDNFFSGATKHFIGRKIFSVNRSKYLLKYGRSSILYFDTAKSDMCQTQRFQFHKRACRSPLLTSK